ncbi:MAG TPA: type I DNA topoisomerase, partial [Clostridiales bacterium]|nr:type I DNA topoisomerase [Clostridiales bacterium]
MAKNLVIVESASKATTIKKYLGKNYKVVASLGHVRDLPKSQMGIDLENDYEPKYITIRGKGDIIAKLKKDAKGVDHIYLATDPDREGEAIAWHLAYILKIDPNEKVRITFHEITKSAVVSSVKKPRAVDIDLVDAQQTRRFIDRIVGYSISPILWKKVKKGLSAGRVQSVAVRMICDREDEINAFVQEEYWTLAMKGQVTGSDNIFEAMFYGQNNVKMELASKEQTDAIVEHMKKADFTITSVKKGTKTRSPAAPFTTSTLQQDAARKLNFTTKKTMMLAQQLYEGVDIKGSGSTGLVTYIRTDSKRISDDAANAAKQYILDQYGESYLPSSPRIYKNKSSAQDAHEAIRPTDLNLQPELIKESLSRDQYRLYKLIWERFIASQMANAEYDTIRAEITDQDGYIFRANGLKTTFKGFIKIYTEGRDEEDEDEKDSELPQLNEGDKVSVLQFLPKQNFTQPPARYNEASLVKALEDNGIGRPSTYSPTISTIISRGYVGKEKKTLFPTDLGKIVNDVMLHYFPEVVNLTFTASLEERFDDVEEGTVQWKKVVDDFYKSFSVALENAQENMDKIEIPDEVSDVICEKCGRNMVVKLSRTGKFLACPGFPECRNTKPI